MGTSRRLFRISAVIASLVLFLAGCSIGSIRFSLPDPSPIIPSDTLFDEQWNLRSMQMPEAWGLLHDPLVARIANNRQGITPVVVAVLDTEIDVNHPDLSANVLGEAYRSSGLAVTSPVPGTDTEHHGTHVAGIVAADTDNGTGVSGVGSRFLRVLPVTVLNERGGGSSSTVLEGMLYAAGMSSVVPPRTADVINMSLGGSAALGTDFESALGDIFDAGITVIASAGNSGGSTGLENTVEYPARYPTVVAAGSAYGPDLSSFTFAPYTAFGPEVDLVAPGGSGISSDTYGRILSTQIVSGSTRYLELAGTSQAAPHVAGVAALMRAVNQDLTPLQITHILRETASPAATDPDRYGAGMLNAHAAIAAALSSPYGPFARNEFSASPVGLEPDDPDNLGLRTSVRGGEPEAGRSARRFAAEGPAGNELPRIIITLDRTWFRSTDDGVVEAALHDIAERHGLGPIRFLGNRFPSFAISEQQTGRAELLLQLVDEAFVHDAVYDVPLSLTGAGGTTNR